MSFMKNSHIVMILMCSLLFINLGTAQGIDDTSKKKGSSALKELIDTVSFEIVSDWAYPRGTRSINFLSNSGLLPLGSTASQISLISNTNYLRMDGDVVSGYLPFYGEQQVGGGYSTADAGINFEGIPEDLDITEGRKGSYKIRFKIRSNKTTEFYTVFIKLFKDLTTDITINSTHRTSINYRGTVTFLKNTSD